jgi:hypothetical protein
MRPADETEIACLLEQGDDGVEHETHRGELRDFAYAGSVTAVEWAWDDRRSFRGEWPGDCPSAGCILPTGHRGEHAT